MKLSEQEFGGAKDDKAHRIKFESTYEPKLSKCCSAELMQPATFFANYQILRNLWLAARDPPASVVFLMPRANTALWEQLAFVMGHVSESLRERIFIVAIEDVLARLAKSESLPGRMTWYAELLAEKYLTPSAPG